MHAYTLNQDLIQRTPVEDSTCRRFLKNVLSEYIPIMMACTTSNLTYFSRGIAMAYQRGINTDEMTLMLETSIAPAIILPFYYHCKIKPRIKEYEHRHDTGADPKPLYQFKMQLKYLGILFDSVAISSIALPFMLNKDNPITENMTTFGVYALGSAALNCTLGAATYFTSIHRAKAYDRARIEEVSEEAQNAIWGDDGPEDSNRDLELNTPSTPDRQRI